MVDTTWLSVSGIIQPITIALTLVLFALLSIESRRFYRLQAIILLVALLAEVAGIIGGMILRVNMNPGYSIYAILEGPLLLVFYRKQISSPRIRLLALFLAAFLFLFAIMDFVYLHGPLKINSYSKVATSITMMVVCVYYFFLLIRELPTESITRLPMFWMNTALLTYFAGAFAANLATDYLVYVIPQPSLKIWIATWTVHNSIAIASYVGIGLAFVLERKRAKSRIEPAG